MANILKGEITTIAKITDGEDEIVILQIQFNRVKDEEFFRWIMGKYAGNKPVEVKLEDQGLEATFM